MSDPTPELLAACAEFLDKYDTGEAFDLTPLRVAAFVQAREQAARADAIADCADAAAQDAQVIVTSLGNMKHGDTTGKEFDRAMKAALNVTKRIRALTEPKEPRG